MSILIFIPLTLITAILERPRRYPADKQASTAAYRKRVNRFETIENGPSLIASRRAVNNPDA